MIARCQGILKERSRRNQVFKENVRSIVGQPDIKKELRRTGRCTCIAAGGNTLVEGEQDA